MGEALKKKETELRKRAKPSSDSSEAASSIIKQRRLMSTSKREEGAPLDEFTKYREYRRRLATTFPDCPDCWGTGVLADYLWSSKCARCFSTGKVFSLDSF